MAASSRPPTINDVAEAAGVSRATASRALAGYGRVNEETTRTVKEAAARIGKHRKSFCLIFIEIPPC